MHATDGRTPSPLDRPDRDSVGLRPGVHGRVRAIDPEARAAARAFDRAILPHPDDDATARTSAMEWLWARTELEDINPVLVTNEMTSAVPEYLDPVWRLGGRLSPRSQVDFGTGPVVAYRPAAKALRLAERLADGSSLLVIESPTTEWATWADDRGAWDARAGRRSSAFPVPDPVWQGTTASSFALRALGARLHG